MVAGQSTGVESAARASSRSARWPTVLGAFLLDAGLVLLFVVVGRHSHDEALTFSGVVTTYWPFLVGLIVGWLVTWAWKRPAALIWPGIPLWLMTVALGMLIRTSVGQGVEPSFIAVALGVLGFFLVGWRLAALPYRRRHGLSRF